MKRTKKVLCLTLALTMISSILTGCGKADAPSGKDSAQEAAPGEVVYKIASIGPLTGDSSQYGISLRNAAELMAEIYNEAGGVNGGKIVIEVYDDKNDPKETVNIANKLIADESVLGVCGPFSSTCAMAAAPIFEKAQIPMISPTSSHPDLTKNNDFIFRATRTQDIETGEYVRFASDILKSKTVGIIYAQNDWGMTINDVFTKGFEEKGGVVAVSEPYIVGQTKDFSPLISKVKAAGVDTFFLVAMYDDAAKIIKQAHSLELDAKYVAPSSVLKDEFIDLLGEDAEGLFLMSGFIPGSDDPVYRAADEAYMKKYGTPIDQFGMGSYDVIMMFAEAIKDVGADRAGIRDWLLGMVDFRGCSGLYTMTPEGDPLKPCFPMIVKDGQFIEYK